MKNIRRDLLMVVFSLMHLLRHRLPTSKAGQGMTELQVRTLGMIRGGLNHVGKLACCNQVSQPAMSKTVGQLVARGLVERASEPSDRRQIALRVTAAGSRRVEEIQAHALEGFMKRFSRLPQADKAAVQQAIAVLGRLIVQELPDRSIFFKEAR